MGEAVIIVAGSSGNLGGRIVKFLSERKVRVRALVRQGAPEEKIKRLKTLGIEVIPVDFDNHQELTKACRDGTCVVSALSGLREVIVDAQSKLLEGAVKAGVPRFIPSDYSIDFLKVPPGSNRNLDLRREFHQRLNASPLSATSIFNGAFTDMLTGKAPFILFKLRRVLCWQSPDQKMDFTTIQDTANYTSLAALDPATPRYLRIAGDQISARDLSAIVTEITGQEFRPFCPGNLAAL